MADEGAQVELVEALDSAETTTSIIEIEGASNLQEQAVGLIERIPDLLSLDALIQIAVICFFSFISSLYAVFLRRKFVKYTDGLDIKETRKFGKTFINGLRRIILPASISLLLFVCSQIAQLNNWPSGILSIASGLSFAWLAVTFASSFIESKAISKWVAIIVWGIAALYIMGWWEGTISLLESVNFSLGQERMSLLMVIKGSFFFVCFLWVAVVLSRAAEKKIRSLEELTPSLKVLFSKILKISLICIAFLLGLNAIGVDLTSFAIFGGAIGVGIGFGLQKVVSNFISGILLLMDRSIKPGDVIAIGNGANKTYGWVNTLGARYVSIIQRDGKEHLIPNELLITDQVENWSFSNNDIRVHIPIGVSYKSDVRKAMDLCLEAAQEETRVKQFPEPVVRVCGFGDSSVNVEIRVWISDPVNGIGNIRSSVLLSVWDKFRENGIEIPYPQRDIHIRSLDNPIKEAIKAELKQELKQELQGGT